MLANNSIDFEVRPGEIHALLGENGAGKTTLAEILYGTFSPDAGQIFLNGQPVTPKSPGEALALGIGMVHQHFRLEPRFKVTENIALGLRSPRFWLNLSEVRERILELSARYGLQVNPDAHIWQLSVGEQQRVEILKMLYRQVRILILDEPTAVLTPLEVENLFGVLRQLAQEGCGIILITHKLEEVMAVADRITVLRNGQVVKTLPREEAQANDLVRMMVGEELPHPTVTLAPNPEGLILEIADLVIRTNGGPPAVRGVSLKVGAGEILGLAGVAGNGQTELVQAILGGTRVASGKITIMGVETTHSSPGVIASLGVGHIPEDRQKEGLALGLPVADNLIAREYPRLGQGPLLDPNQVTQFARRLLEQYDIRPPDPSLLVGRLSGGNQQRILLARELASRPSLLIAVHPTRGLDIRATQVVRSILIKMKERKGAVLLVSEDLTEIMEISDVVAVISSGQIMGIDKRDNLVDDDRLAHWMAGICDGRSFS